MCEEILDKMFCRAVKFVEANSSGADIEFYVEKREDESEIGTLFSEPCIEYVRLKLRNVLQDLSGVEFSENLEVFTRIEALRHIIARAVFLYRLNVGDDLEAFCREYDHLHEAWERRKLWSVMQK